jgi:anti-anti-sigma factor
MGEQIVRAPTILAAESRGTFQDQALRALKALGDHEPGRLIVDLSATERVDSAGLSTLVLLQLRAAERRHTVCLQGVSEEVRFLLLMTRLEDRFEIHPRA